MVSLSHGKYADSHVEIDFTTMRQTDAITGNSREVQRQDALCRDGPETTVIDI